MKNVPKKVAEAIEHIVMARKGTPILSDAITLMEFIEGLPEDKRCRTFVNDDLSAKHCRRCGMRRDSGDHAEGEY